LKVKAYNPESTSQKCGFRRVKSPSHTFVTGDSTFLYFTALSFKARNCSSTGFNKERKSHRERCSAAYPLLSLHAYSKNPYQQRCLLVRHEKQKTKNKYNTGLFHLVWSEFFHCECNNHRKNTGKNILAQVRLVSPCFKSGDFMKVGSGRKERLFIIAPMSLSDASSYSSISAEP
jgi:hypothetical protein